MTNSVDTNYACTSSSAYAAEIQGYFNEIDVCYNSLGKYTAPSMDNICELFNKGFKDESDYFYVDHMAFCNEYGDKALAFGNSIKDESDTSTIQNALFEVKKATLKAIIGLKKLITKEKEKIEELGLKSNDAAKDKVGSSQF